MATVRETITTLLNGADELRQLGLPANAVFQADTADEVMLRPFIVLRWGDQYAGMGPVGHRPLTIWCYDSPGDYTRAEKIGKKAVDLLGAIEQMPTTDGWILRVDTMFNSQDTALGQGGDLFDDGYDCVVIPFYVRPVASGS